MTAADMIDALAGMSTATISDAMFRMGHKNRTMRHSIKPVDPAMKLHGPACTAHAYPGGTYATGLALQAAKPGEVIVIDAQGWLEAVMWGEICSLQAMAGGIAGAVIDGAVRDIAEVIELGFPLFAAGITPAAGTGDKLGEVNIPIQCGGVVVRPGDLIFGDLLGVVVVPPEELGDVHDWCEKVLEKEEQIKADLQTKLAHRWAGGDTP
ncbi:MAG: RraA family protein [Armatimonadetes bacterium]|nr:RraA family protein [Armatimonadota bacterium]